MREESDKIRRGGEKREGEDQNCEGTERVRKDEESAPKR